MDIEKRFKIVTTFTNCKSRTQKLYKSPVYNVCKSLVRIKITALTIDAHKGFTYVVVKIKKGLRCM